MIVSGGLLLISQRSNDSIENCMIEDYSNFDISVSESENTLDSSLKTTDEEKAAIQSECIVISELYREIYQQAPKVPSQYFGAENDITQETIDEIENILIAAGYSVINSDSIYPEYLEHSDCVNAFWECVKQQTDAEVSFWGVSSTGGLYYAACKVSALLPQMQERNTGRCCTTENGAEQVSRTQKVQSQLSHS